MSSTSHLTVAQTKETKVNKRHSSFNLRTSLPDGTSQLHQTSSTTTNSNNLYNVNVEPVRNKSIRITHSLTPASIITGAPLSGLRKLSAISLPVPWYKRTRSPSDDKSSTDSFSKHSQQQHSKSHNPHKMSRDRLLTLDRLFSSGTHTTNDDDQISPTTESTALDESMRTNEKTMKQIKENGYLHSSQLMTR
jgi:hypothetical protein